MRKLYSPRISSDFIPALYQHSKDINSPMTGTVNRYVIQGLAADALSSTVKDKLPDSYAKGIKSLGLDDIVQRSYADAGFDDECLRPFGSTEEIAAWHEQSLNGVKKAMLTSEINAYESRSRNGRLFGDDWLYRTIALNLNRGLTSALVGYSLQPSDR
jgi:hypothetical protein